MMPPYIYVLVQYDHSAIPRVRGAYVKLSEVQDQCRKISEIENIDHWDVYRLKEGIVDNVQKLLSADEKVGKK